MDEPVTDPGWLHVNLRLLSSSYAAAVDSHAEWPPHPHRLFAALVATAGRGRTDEQTAALAWLETLDPPTVTAPVRCPNDPDVEDGPVRYVPSANMPYAALRGGLSKGVAPRANSAGGLKASGATNDPETWLMGETLNFSWALPTPPPAGTVAVLDDLAAQVVYLGRATTLVQGSATLTPTLPPAADDQERWVPGQGSTRVRVPQTGLLNFLDETFARTSPEEPPTKQGSAKGPPPRWMHTVTYGPPPEPTTEPTLASVPDSGPVAVFEFTDRDGQPLRIPAEAMRQTATRAAALIPDDVNVAAVPHVNGTHATGDLFGILAHSPDLAALRAATQTLTATPITVAGTTVHLQAVNPADQPPWVLTDRRWTQPATVWMTATPWIPPRHPKSFADAEQILTDELTDRGYPTPAVVTCQEAPFLTGALGARDSRRHDTRIQWSAHAVIVFDQPVAGPIQLGGGHLGLFAPVPTESHAHD